ncbi:hypothetical protein ABT084_03195 [Streptomyces sp. NPDC002138]|uniref:hypothetical protein n=1 Tax=Streptomyces sp. NPDC002138 TaxID=3154410 RepID=UPI00332447E4
MGPDDEDSVWEVGIDLFLLNRGNAYDGLACLFGIRNFYGFPPLAEDRGFPDDASDGLQAEFAGYSGPHDVHGTTWLTWAERDTTDRQETNAGWQCWPTGQGSSYTPLRPAWSAPCGPPAPASQAVERVPPVCLLRMVDSSDMPHRCKK